MVVPVSPPLRERVDPRDEQRGAETEGDQSGGEPQPRVDAFGREDAFRGQDQEAEAEHRRGVHHRDRGADGGGLPERAVGCRSGTRRSATSRDRDRANGSAPTPIATAIIKAIEARRRDRIERRSRRGARRSPAPPPRTRAAPARVRRPAGTSRLPSEHAREPTSVGYERSRSLALSLGTSDRTIVAPSPTAVTSRHPRRSA